MKNPTFVFSNYHRVTLPLARINDLMVRHLNLYVGKERIHCFPVVRPVAMNQMQLSWWSGATEIQNNRSRLVIRRTTRVILDFMCMYVGDV